MNQCTTFHSNHFDEQQFIADVQKEHSVHVTTTRKRKGDQPVESLRKKKRKKREQPATPMLLLNVFLQLL